MQRYRVILSPAAVDDLEQIHRTISADSPQNADRFVGALLDRAIALADVPHANRAVGRSRSSGLVVRVIVEKPYLIYYGVAEKPPQVRVIEFRHGARRQPRRFE